MTAARQLFDRRLRAVSGAGFLVGVDEAGRGPLAGPVVAAAVVLPRRGLAALSGARDSKALTPRRRAALFDAIRERAVAVSAAWSTAAEIDAANILAASLAAMRRAAARVLASARPGSGAPLVLVDGNRLIPGLGAPQRTIVGGDDLSLSIACASIVAKVLRDRWMEGLDRRYPGWGLARHKGYPTAEHRLRLRSLGATPAHRRSFAPVGQLSLPV